MAHIPAKCPSCQDDLAVTRLCCSSCNTQLEGTFELPELLRLSAEDLKFVENFVTSSGSLKEMARIEGQSYPTIRGRLNDIIEQLIQHKSSTTAKQHEILDAIAKGTISVAEATRQLRGGF